MTSLEGTYSLVDYNSDQFEAYMVALGVNYLLRKAGKIAHQKVTITFLDSDGNNFDFNSKNDTSDSPAKFHLITKGTVKSSNDIFILNQKNDYKTMDGRKATALVTYDKEKNEVSFDESWTDSSNKIRKCSQKWRLKPDNGNLELFLECDNVLCTRGFERV